MVASRWISRADILERVQSIASSILGLPSLDLREEMTARDVPGWDSLDSRSNHHRS